MGNLVNEEEGLRSLPNNPIKLRHENFQFFWLDQNLIREVSIMGIFYLIINIGLDFFDVEFEISKGARLIHLLQPEINRTKSIWHHGHTLSSIIGFYEKTSWFFLYFGSSEIEGLLFFSFYMKKWLLAAFFLDRQIIGGIIKDYWPRSQGDLSRYDICIHCHFLQLDFNTNHGENIHLLPIHNFFHHNPSLINSNTAYNDRLWEINHAILPTDPNFCSSFCSDQNNLVNVPFFTLIINTLLFPKLALSSQSIIFFHGFVFFIFLQVSINCYIII